MAGGKVKTIEQIRTEKNSQWDDIVEATGCKKEIDDMQKCSMEGDWRKCQEQMIAVKECMNKVADQKPKKNKKKQLK